MPKAATQQPIQSTMDATCLRSPLKKKVLSVEGGKGNAQGETADAERTYASMLLQFSDAGQRPLRLGPVVELGRDHTGGAEHLPAACTAPRQHPAPCGTQKPCSEATYIGPLAV